MANAKGANLSKITKLKLLDSSKVDQFCNWFCCWTVFFLVTQLVVLLSPSPVLLATTAPSAALELALWSRSFQGSPAWINRGRGGEGAVLHYWIRPAQQLSPWASIFLNRSMFGRKLSLPRGEWLRRGFMKLCITLRCSIMTRSQVLNSQDPAKSIVGSCDFFPCFNVFCALKQGPLTREHALACGCTNDLAHRPRCHTSLVISHFPDG